MKRYTAKVGSIRISSISKERLVALTQIAEKLYGKVSDRRLIHYLSAQKLPDFKELPECTGTCCIS